MKSAAYWLMTYACGTAGVISLALMPLLADALTAVPGMDIPYAASFFMALFFLVPLAGVFFFLALFFRRRARRKL